MPARHQKIVIKIPSEYKPDERIAISEEILAFIRKRTEDGIDRKGNDFPKYSQSYINSLDFKNAGKSKGSVNLRLSGDMMAELGLLGHGAGEIRIGFEKGTDENNKADGNIRGTYGSDSENKSKARDFLGISAADMSEILSRFPLGKENKEERTDRVKVVLSSVEEASKTSGST